MKQTGCVFLVLCSFFSCHANSAPQPDTHYMQIAIGIAKQNPHAPFGALIVDHKTGQILCKGLNVTAKEHNPTLHGEMVAINACAKKYPKLDWKSTILYTTAEPCPMCQSAIIWAGIPRVVYGTSIPFLEQQHWEGISLRAEEVNSHAHFYHGTVKGGVLAEITNPLFLR